MSGVKSFYIMVYHYFEVVKRPGRNRGTWAEK
jgi:hypothetical protein